MKKNVFLTLVFCLMFHLGTAQKVVILPRDVFFSLHQSFDASFWALEGVFIKDEHEPLLVSLWDKREGLSKDTLNLDDIFCTGILMKSVFGKRMQVPLCNGNDILSGDFKELDFYYSQRVGNVPLIDRMHIGDTLRINQTITGCYSSSYQYQICRVGLDAYYLLSNGLYPQLEVSQEAKNKFRHFELMGQDLNGGCTSSISYDLELNREVYSFFIMDGCSKDAFDVFIEAIVTHK